MFVDVLGLERDGTNGLSQSLVSKTTGYSIWVEIRGTGVGVCWFLLSTDSSGWSPSLVREFGNSLQKAQIDSGVFAKRAKKNLGTNLGSFWCSRWWLHICFVVLTAISCGNDRIWRASNGLFNQHRGVRYLRMDHLFGFTWLCRLLIHI